MASFCTFRTFREDKQLYKFWSAASDWLYSVIRKTSGNLFLKLSNSAMQKLCCRAALAVPVMPCCAAASVVVCLLPKSSAAHTTLNVQFVSLAS